MFKITWINNNFAMTKWLLKCEKNNIDPDLILRNIASSSPDQASYTTVSLTYFTKVTGHVKLLNFTFSLHIVINYFIIYGWRKHGKTNFQVQNNNNFCNFLGIYMSLIRKFKKLVPNKFVTVLWVISYMSIHKNNILNK